MSKLYCCLAVAVFGFQTACATGGSSTNEDPVAKLALPKLPFDQIPLGESSFELEEAESIVKKIESKWIPANNQPQRNPKSLKDVEKILKLDQATLFANAVEFASEEDGLEAKVLVAQIQLAWGEAYTILTEILLRLSRRIDILAMSLQQIEFPTAKEKAELDYFRNLTDRITRVGDLFQVISLEHTSRGSQLARQIIEEHPDSYLGYRLAADYKRMIREWDGFDKMIAKIESKNPTSNGLIFLRGAAELHRNNDPEAAQSFYKQALANDSAFVRAQAHLVMSQEDWGELQREFLNLKKKNPNHQIIRWLQPLLKIVTASEL